jgi:hypothetical protein
MNNGKVIERSLGIDTITEAVRRMVAGDVETGLALYETYLQVPDLPRPPVGLHATFLEKAGQGQAAVALVAMGVKCGADVAIKAGDQRTDPLKAAQEYEDLFERGLVNAWMVQSYALALTRLGRGDEVGRLFNQSGLLRIVQLKQDDLADSAAQLLLQHETNGVWQDAVQSVRKMTKVRRVHELPEAYRLVAALECEATRYLEDWRTSTHCFASLIPEAFEVRAWGLISRGDGFNARHVHPVGWATGVYYPAGLSSEGARGALQIGRPEFVPQAAKGWPEATIRPEKGLLVLMPSFYTHWTEPLGEAALRLSIAFDLVPLDK